jgi:hypothetical protein
MGVKKKFGRVFAAFRPDDQQSEQRVARMLKRESLNKPKGQSGNGSALPSLTTSEYGLHQYLDDPAGA